MILRHRFMRLTRKHFQILGIILVAYVALGSFIYALVDITHDDYCTADITVYEDNSWGGGALTYNGKVLDKHWDQHMTTWQYPPQVGNTMCTMGLTNRSRT